MTPDVEEVLRRELRQVAGGVAIPAVPPLPQESTRSERRWQPYLIGVAVALVFAGSFAVVNEFRADSAPNGGEPAQPASQSPAPTENPTPLALTADAPLVPYLLDDRLYVNGEALSGSWWLGTLMQGDGTWVAQRDDDSWWWGTDAEPHALPGEVVGLARVSPDGQLLSYASTQDGGQVVVIDTETGEAFGTLSISMDDPNDANSLAVMAITNEAQVILESDRERLLWLAPDTDETVDLEITAPKQQIQGNTTAGLIAYDYTKDGEPDALYLGAISNSGDLTRLRTLVSQDSVANPSGTLLAYGGSWGGESETDPDAHVVAVEGALRVTLKPPHDQGLLGHVVAWESDNLFVVELVNGNQTQLARCSVQEGARCLLIDMQ